MVITLSVVMYQSIGKIHINTSNTLYYYLCMWLTLRGLSLFFKILPISNTVDSIAYILATVHFLYPKLGSFSDMEYYFYQLAYWDSKVPKRFVGLNQMQCSPSFDWNWAKQNDPTACWHQLHPRFRVLQQGKCLRYPPERVGGVTETTNCVGGEGLRPLAAPVNGGHPPLKFPPYSLFRPKGGQKTINFLPTFMGLSLTPITSIWSAS